MKNQEQCSSQVSIKVHYRQALDLLEEVNKKLLHEKRKRKFWQEKVKLLLRCQLFLKFEQEQQEMRMLKDTYDMLKYEVDKEMIKWGTQAKKDAYAVAGACKNQRRLESLKRKQKDNPLKKSKFKVKKAGKDKQLKIVKAVKKERKKQVKQKGDLKDMRLEDEEDDESTIHFESKGGDNSIMDFNLDQQ